MNDTASEIEELAQLAAAWLRAAGVDVSTDSLYTLAVEEMAYGAQSARIVAATASLEVLSAVGDAIESGAPATWAAGRAPAEILGKGLLKAATYRDGTLQAGIRSAHSLGRYNRAKAGGLPKFIYRTMRDDRVRDTHAALNGVALSRDHAFWDLRYPPNGPRCRCLAYSVDQDGLDQLREAGIPVQTRAPKEEMITHRNRTTGEEITLPESVTPGWHYHPREQGRALAALLNEKLAALKA